MAISQENKERLFRLGQLGLYLFLPYSLTCIAIGGVYYALFQRKDDHSGDGFLGVVLGAPMILPALILEKLEEANPELDLLGNRAAEQERVALIQRIGNFLVTNLRVMEIPVQSSYFSAGMVQVSAEALDATQRRRFGDVVARTIAQFPDVPLETICANLSPLDALDEAWATRHGIKDWAVTFTLPCPLCGTTGKDRWTAFGRTRAEEGRNWLLRGTACSLQNGNGITRRIQGGFVCDPCIAKIMEREPEHTQNT